MKTNKNQLLEIVDAIPFLITILGNIGLIIGCAIDCIFLLIAIFTGTMCIPANIFLLLLCIPGLGTPTLVILSALIIGLLKFFIE